MAIKVEEFNKLKRMAQRYGVDLPAQFVDQFGTEYNKVNILQNVDEPCMAISIPNEGYVIACLTKDRVVFSTTLGWVKDDLTRRLVLKAANALADQVRSDRMSWRSVLSIVSYVERQFNLQ